MDIMRRSKPSLTPAVLNRGDRLLFSREDGETVRIELVATAAWVVARDFPQTGPWVKGDISVYAFSATFLVDNSEVVVEREVGSQASFSEPLEVAGIRLWLDAVQCIFDTSYDHATDAGGFLVEKDFLNGAVCMPKADARIAVWDAGRSLCPEPIRPWFGDAPWEPDISQCYNGEDCWMGPYAGAFAHSGLDINMPAGTPLTAPIAVDEQYLVHRVDAGMRNNRWYGWRHWPDHVTWQIGSSHVVAMLCDEHQALAAGTPYASGAGTAVGTHEHSHFSFLIHEFGGEYRLDPWLLFWQMRRDAGLA